MKFKIKLLDGAIAPTYTRDGDAGMDLRSMEELILAPGERYLVKTGVCIELPKGYAADIIPRSGLAARNGITCLNTPGLVDSNYRGEIHVLLINLGHRSFVINKGDRVAQMVIKQVPYVEWDVVEELSETNRGAKGFGSSGVK